MPENIQANEQNEKVEDSWDKAGNNQPLLQNMNITSDLNDIQPRAMPVCKYDEIGFDPIGRWNKVICNYKFFPGEKIWKVQTGYQAPFWCTLLIFT